MRVACFTPLTPVKSGISDYVEDLTPHLLKKGVEFDFIYEDVPPVNEFITNNCSVHPHMQFPDLVKDNAYDLIVYHIGNNVLHNYMYEYFFKYPGLTVLHDYILHHSRLTHYVSNKNLTGYMAEMGMIGNYDIARIVSSGMGGEFLYYNFPVNRLIIKESLSLIVHNSYIKKKIEKDYPGKKVFLIPHNSKKYIVSEERKARLRADIGIPSDALVLASFGFMGESKQINLTSMALRYLMPKFPNLYYLICGEDKEGIVRKEYFNYPGIMDKVKVSGYIDGLENFVEYMAISDIVINLRFPSAGETSGTMIRSMAQGKPVFTYDNPSLIDIPDDSLIKISLTDDLRQLILNLEKLLSDPKLRAKIGTNAQRYAEKELDMDLNADKYMAAFEAARS